MMCIKDLANEAKTKFNESKNLMLERSYDIKMSLAKNGESDAPIKSVSLHHNCSTPLIKVLILSLGVIMAFTFITMLMKSIAGKSSNCCE